LIGRSLKKAGARATIAGTDAAMIVMASIAFYQLDRWTLPGAAVMALMTMVIAFPVAGMGILGIGLPAHWLLHRLGRVSIGYYVAIAAIVSLVLARWFVGRDVFFGQSPYGEFSDEAFDKTMAASILIAGPVAALVFWLTLRPDLEPEPDLRQEN
jgi:hypothetical protein